MKRAYAKRLLGAAAVIGAATLFPVQGQAIVIDGSSAVNDRFTIDWFVGAGHVDGTQTTSIDLSASALFSVLELDLDADGSIKFNIDFANTTTLSGTVALAEVTSFGIGVSPNATGVTFDDDDQDDFDNAKILDAAVSFPGGFEQIDVCVYAQGCQGAALGNGLAAGASDSFMLTIAGDFSGGSLTLSPFPIKFQTSDGNFKFAGTESNAAEVPEPASLAIVGIGLLGLGWTAGRRRRDA